jgi:cellulose biosynthesis protein BcsQ
MFAKKRIAQIFKKVSNSMKTITVAHYKGGTGKTTLCLMMCQVLALAGYRVLAVDMDVHQNHLAQALGGAEREQPSSRNSKASASDILDRIVRKNASPNLDVAALSTDWCDRGSTDPFHLRKRFRFFNFAAAYDFVIIDTPPGMGRVQEISMHAADEICIPTDLSGPSLSSLARILTVPNITARWRIIPNELKKNGATSEDLMNLRMRYPAKAASPALVYDEGFAGCFSQNQVPFYKLVSRTTALYCCRLVADLFALDSRKIELTLATPARKQEISAAEAVVFPETELPAAFEVRSNALELGSVPAA